MTRGDRMNTEKYFIMGLPAAGKTTYLAALWYVLDNSTDSCFKINKYAGDLTYMTNIANKWVGAEELSRTHKSTEKLKIELPLKSSHDEDITLAFPDLSGESFQGQYEEREIKVKHSKLITDCSGVFLFIHPEKIKEPFLIPEVPALIRKCETEDTSTEEKVWDIKEVPTQVQLVELLQFLIFLRNSQPVSLAIVVSAWDRINKAQTPEQFIKERLPLLWQYLMSNSEFLSITYCGVSAQGGDLSESEKLLEITNPCDRITVIDNEGNKFKDITLLISWILNIKNE